MRIEYFHASKYGNGAKVAEEFTRIMRARDSVVNVHHIRDAKAQEMPPADLYVFSSPGRFGKPIGGMRRFLKKVDLPTGARYAILTTEAGPGPDKETGETSPAGGQDPHQRVRPIMDELLAPKHLQKVAEGSVLVTGLRGPLEDGWQQKVDAFAARVSAAGPA